MQAKKIDYRRRKKDRPSFSDREHLKSRLYQFSNQTQLAVILKTSVQNINRAFAGYNVELLDKVTKQIEKFETAKNDYQ